MRFECCDQYSEHASHCVYTQYDLLKAENGRLYTALKFLIDHSPHDGDTDYACMYCDMGGAGYSPKGDGNHDDHPKCVCPVVVAKKALEGIPPRCKHGVHGEDCFACFPT